MSTDNQDKNRFNISFDGDIAEGIGCLLFAIAFCLILLTCNHILNN